MTFIRLEVGADTIYIAPDSVSSCYRLNITDATYRFFEIRLKDGTTIHVREPIATAAALFALIVAKFELPDATPIVCSHVLVGTTRGGIEYE